MIKASKFIDGLFTLIILSITILAFYLSYALHLSGPIIAIVWLLWFLGVLGFGYFTSKGQAIFDFTLQAKSELLKVVWPTRKETVQTTIIVVVMVSIAGFSLWLADSGMMWTIGKITHLG
ncbi:MAG: preprotein translocase subunit SecE [Legionellaceae bacterium]|nr:preprotein translocase subunit SecE [Legionellaceae bacterium]